MPPRVQVAILSDFGTTEWFVGVMKSVVLHHAPEACLIDITHEVPPYQVAQGAAILEACWQDFPVGTVFLAVVDPGVGGEREAVLVYAGRRWFVGPNNGLFAWLARGDVQVWKLDVPSGSSATFHGRDLFAPVAGRIAAGVSPEACTSGFTTLAPLADQPAYRRIVLFDRFGNAITDLRREDVGSSVQSVELPTHSRQIAVVRTYGDVPPGDALAYWGSAGRLEIAVREGDARRSLGLAVGDEVRCVESFEEKP